MKSTSLSQLTPEQKELISAAETVAPRAYNTNSGYCVGAALRSNDGQIFIGANYENMACDSLCAEQVALASASATGATDISEIAVYATKQNGAINEPISPCGQCRQYLAQAAARQKHPIKIIMVNSNASKIILSDSEELLPLKFSKE